ncbi:MAG: hypothetical protein JWO32_1783 [Bacteroidetes bacterium]|nr:hypothetical protein [Bacteroidota bacterium]
MKKIILLLLLSLSLQLFSQAPATINYQGVARNSAGTPVTNTVVTIQFKISSSTNPNFYSEIQNAVPVNSLGLLSTKIGMNTPLPVTGWEDTPTILQVFMDINGTGLISLGSQTLSSVPYALYSLNSGNTLPAGTLNGQTLRWDSISNIWKVSSNLTNDEQRVAVGLLPGSLPSKMSVGTFNPLDSAAFTSIHYFAQNSAASIRAAAFGSTSNTNTLNIFSTAIFGGQHVAYNTGSGYAVGNFGYGVSPGFGVGLLGLGSAKASNGVSIGVYGSTDSTSTTKRFAGYFDKGGVLIKDSLMLEPSGNPGNIGDVLIKASSNGKVKWSTPPAAASPWTQSPGFIHLNNNSDAVGIGTGTVMPQAQLEILSQTGGSGEVLRINDFSAGTSLHVIKNSPGGPTGFFELNNTSSSSNGLVTQTSGFGFALRAFNSNNSTSAYAGIFDGGLVTKGKSNLYGDFNFIANDNIGNVVFSIRNNGFTTLGSNFFTASKLNIEGNDTQTNYFGYAASPSTGITINNLNQTNNNFSSINFAQSGVESAKIVGLHLNHTPARGELIFLTRDATNINEVLRFTSEGHIKTAGTNLNSNCNSTNSFGASVTANKVTGSNDIKGEVLATVTGTPIIGPGQFVTITVNFDKTYNGVPNVFTEAMNQETASLNRFILSSSTTSFVIKFFNNNSTSMSLNTINFKYFIVE